MKIANTTRQYGLLTRWLHWIVALLVILQYAYIYTREWFVQETSDLSKLLLVELHKPFGVTVLVLAITFLVWKPINPHPAFPKTMSPLEKLAAYLIQYMLLLLSIIMGISGLGMSMTAGYPTGFFGLFEIPMLLSKDLELSHQFARIHEWSGYLLFSCILIHILAALKHHFIDKDHILKRMKLFP